MMVVFWVAVIALVVWLVLGFRSDQATSGMERRHDPEDLVAERFARGEIDEDEFCTSPGGTGRRKACLVVARR